MITRTRPIRPVKTLEQQREERKLRAEEQRSLYRIKWFGCRVTLKSGLTYTELVAGITKRDGSGGYYVTAYGCNCRDAQRAREVGLNRDCKHTVLVNEDFTRLTMQDEDPEPVYVPDEERAEETLLALETARREQVRARMLVDFGPAD